MDIRATTRVEITDETGAVVLAVSATEKRNAGGNPRFLESEAAVAAKAAIDRTLAGIVAATPGAKRSE